MGNKKEKIFSFLLIFFLSAGMVHFAGAFSFFDFLNQLKEKILSPQEEVIVRKIEAKKVTLDEALSLILENYKDEENNLRELCPIETKNLKEEAIFSSLIKKAVQEKDTNGESTKNKEDSSSSLDERCSSIQGKIAESSSTEATSSEEFFKTLGLGEQTNILFEEKACQESAFLEKEISWYENLKENIDEAESIGIINSLAEKLKNHRSQTSEESNLASNLSAIASSLANIKIAENREEKISNNLDQINLDKFTKEVVNKLLLLAKAKIKIASLKTEKAKLLLLYSQSFQEISLAGDSTSSEETKESTSSEKIAEIRKIKKEIALQISLGKEEKEDPMDLLEESQEYLKSAYQDFSLISNIVQLP